MKIITIRQPWADLIVNGSKNIENRDWPTSYRGPVLIYAAKKMAFDGCSKHRRSTGNLMRGGVVEIAEITGCVTRHDSTWFRGRYGFVLRKRRPLRFIKWTGALGLREAPTKLLNRISPRILSEYR